MNKPLLRAGFGWLLAGCLLAGCSHIVPVDTPAQLDYTPGPPVVITDTTYTTTEFIVDIPAVWRTISNAAFAPVSVVFVRPDESAVMVFSVEQTGVPPLPNPPQDGAEFVWTATVEVGDVTVYTGLRGPDTEAESLRVLYESTVASLRVP